MPCAPSLWLSTVSAATKPSSPLSIPASPRRTRQVDPRRARCECQPAGNVGEARVGVVVVFPLPVLPVLAGGLSRSSVFRRGLPPIAVGAVVEGALLFVPSGALAVVDDAVMVGVDLIEALAKQPVALRGGHAGEEIVIGFLPFERGAARRRQILYGEFG